MVRARVCESLREFARVCESLREFARVCVCCMLVVTNENKDYLKIKFMIIRKKFLHSSKI
jgi:hypothetical protein